MKQKLMILMVLIVTLSLSGVVWSDVRLSSVTNAEDLYGENAFIGVHSDGAAIMVFDGLTGDSANIVYAAYGHTGGALPHASGYIKQATIHQVIYTSNDRLFYTVTMDGTVYLVEKTNSVLTPMMYNGEAVVVDGSNIVQATAGPNVFESPASRHLVIDSGVSSTMPLREDGGNLYYLKSTSLHQMSLGSVLPTVYKTMPTVSGTRTSFDIIDDVIYQSAGRIDGYNPQNLVYKDSDILVTGSKAGDIAGSLSFTGSIRAVGPELIYVQTRAAKGTASVTLSGIYNSTGGYIGALPGSTTLPGSSSGIALLNNDPIGAFTRYSSGVEVVTTVHTATDRTTPVLPDSDYDYEINVLNSRAATYYNNSALDARYHMKINAGNSFNAHKHLIAETTFELLVYGPEGQITGRYTVPSSSWEYSSELGDDYVSLYGYAETSRSVEFQTPPEEWEPGEYTYRMTEYTSDGGTKLVNTHTVTVTNVSGTVEPGVIDPETATGSDIWDSKAFKAIMLICIPALALGIVLSVPGAMVGLVLGVFLSFALGFLSFTWVIIIVLAIVASFATFLRDMITGGGPK